MELNFLAKTRKKELTFHINDPKKQQEFFERVRKKCTMVDVHLMMKHNKIRVKLSGTHESLRYAIEIIKNIQKSLVD